MNNTSSQEDEISGHGSEKTLIDTLQLRAKEIEVDFTLDKPLNEFVAVLLEDITEESFNDGLDEFAKARLNHIIKNQTNANFDMKEIEKAVKDNFKRNNMPQIKAVFERSGETHVRSNSSVKRVTNFVLEPEYLIERFNATNGGGTIHEHLYCFNMKVKNENFPHPKTSTIILKAPDFDSEKKLQEATSRIGGRIINGSSREIAEFANHALNKKFPKVKHGSDVFGLDIVKGRKYFVTPHKVYDVESGEEVDNIVYMPHHDNDPTAEFNLQNLEYDSTKWKTEIAPFFVRHIMRIQKKETMLLLAGWLAAIPVEHVFRKLTHELAGFPHAMLTGLNGGGKSLLASSLLPYLGYSQDTQLTSFSTKMANIQTIEWSYTMPVIFDEYRPNEWSHYERHGVEKLIRESYGRAVQRKSNTDFNLRQFVNRNPMMIMGQMTTSDDANSERIIQMYLDPNFINNDSPESIEAKKQSQEFQSFYDKNFWVGFCIWMARLPESDILKVYRDFKAEVIKAQPTTKDRVRCFCAVVMTGLHFFAKLAEELGVSSEELGYTNTDIILVPGLMSDNRMATQGDTYDLMEQFLQDTISYGITFGNKQGDLFGENRAVQIYSTGSRENHTYGKKNEPANIGERREVVLMKMDTIIDALNRQMNRKYNEKLLNPILKSFFDAGLLDSSNALVLAPNGYRVNGIRYTVFDSEKLHERGFGNIYMFSPESENTSAKA